MTDQPKAPISRRTADGHVAVKNLPVYFPRRDHHGVLAVGFIDRCYGEPGTRRAVAIMSVLHEPSDGEEAWVEYVRAPLVECFHGLDAAADFARRMVERWYECRVKDEQEERDRALAEIDDFVRAETEVTDAAIEENRPCD